MGEIWKRQKIDREPWFDIESFVKELKDKRGIKPNTQVAKEMGVSPHTFKGLLDGKNPNLLTYARACGWLGVSLDTFVKWR